MEKQLVRDTLIGCFFAIQIYLLILKKLT